MDILTRLENLENFVFAMSERIDRNQFYNDADTAGNRQSISEKAPMPYTETKIAYYGESEKVFYNVPSGNLSVFFDNYNGNYFTNHIDNRLTVSFDTLTEATQITISIQ